MEIVVNIESDNILMWIQEDATDGTKKGRVTITKLISWVPKLELTDLGKKIIIIHLLILKNGLLIKLVMNIKEILYQLKEYLISQMQLQDLDM